MRDFWVIPETRRISIRYHPVSRDIPIHFSMEIFPRRDISLHFEGGILEFSISRDTIGIVLDGVISGPVAKKRVRFLLDTGASVCYVHRSIMIGAGYVVGTGKGKVPIHTAGGEVHAEIFNVDSIKIFDLELIGLEVSSYEIPSETRVEGLLGLNFLKHFKMTLDLPNGKLIIQ